MIDTNVETTRMEPAPGSVLAAKIATEELATELLARAETEGVSLVGPGGAGRVDQASSGGGVGG